MKIRGARNGSLGGMGDLLLIRCGGLLTAVTTKLLHTGTSSTHTSYPRQPIKKKKTKYGETDKLL